jgi:hypothetical protein
MAPLPAVPPPPPAIHAPIPVQQVQNAASMPARSVAQQVRLSDFVPVNDLQGGLFNHFRWQHTKHWKGARIKSIKQRTGKAKASRKAKLKRRRHG